MEKLDTNTLKTPLDIPVGTILTQHWCNSTSFYKIVGRTEKSVLVVEVPSKHTRFEHEGGGTGYQYKLPDEERLAVLEKKYKEINAEYGFDVLSKKATQKDFEKAEIDAANKGKRFYDEYFPISNNRSYLLPKRIMVKPAKNGGFYIPGVIRGSWCGNMQLWSGEEVSDYYN